MIRKAFSARRRLLLRTGIIAGVALLTGCAGLSSPELDGLASKINPVALDFNDIYQYAERSYASYAPELAIRAKYPKIVRISAPDQSRVRYVLERDDKKRIQIITIRGTNNNANISEDLNIYVRDDRKIDIPVHSGFDYAAKLLFNDVKPFLKPGYKTYVTGHSLGGAVAAVLAIYLIEDGMSVDRVVTFGQPRFTTAEGVKRLQFLPLTRVVDANDIVPLVPPAMMSDPKFGPFEHVGAEVILLEGPAFVYLPSHDATRIALGEFWRMLSYADIRDHDMEKYLRRIASKTTGASEVPYTQREKFVVTDASQVRR
jgi:hypothetical protein